MNLVDHIKAIQAKYLAKMAAEEKVQEALIAAAPEMAIQTWPKIKVDILRALETRPDMEHHKHWSEKDFSEKQLPKHLEVYLNKLSELAASEGVSSAITTETNPKFPNGLSLQYRGTITFSMKV